MRFGAETGVGQDMNGKLLAGWGEADITPDGRVVELNGQYYQRVATGIHSRLKIMVLLLERNSEISVMASIDNVGIKNDVVRQLQQAVATVVPGLLPERVIVSAIHTHNAPSLSTFRDWWTSTPGAISCAEYRGLVEERMKEAVSDAWNSLQPAGIAGALSSARIGHCRRAVYTVGPAEMYGDTGRDDFAGLEGGEDSGVEMMFFVDEKKQPFGAIVNVPCPSQVMEATYKISSDFMGALREKLKAEFGPGFKMLPQISAAGCQAPRDLVRNYRGEPDFWHEDGVTEIADRLLNAVRSGWSAVKNFDFTPELIHVSRPLPLPRRRASYGEYVAARDEMARLEAIQSSSDAYAEFCAEVLANEKIPGRTGPYDDKKRHFVQIRNCEAVIQRYKEQDVAPDLTIDLHVLRLGNAVFATNPFELFLEFGQRMKARSRAAQTFVVQIANGYDGYLPCARAEQFGGYGGLIINGQVGADGGSKLVDETVRTINGMFC